MICSTNASLVPVTIAMLFYADDEASHRPFILHGNLHDDLHHTFKLNACDNCNILSC